MTEGRSYRFQAIDTSGVLLGMGLVQVGALGSGFVVAATLLTAGLHPIVALLPAVLGTGIAFIRVGDTPLVDAAVPASTFVARGALGRTRWLAPLAGPDPNVLPALPEPMAGQRLVVADGGRMAPNHAGRRIAILHDRRTDRYAASVRVSGRQFALLDALEQERLLSLWGDALAAFCKEGGPVAMVRWAEWAGPSGLEEQRAWLEARSATDSAGPSNSYGEVLNEVRRRSQRHEILVTVAIAGKRVRTAKGRSKVERETACIDCLLTELRQFVGRLDSAGLATSAPLSPEETARALRVRMDPLALPGLDLRGRSLGDLAGLVPIEDATPMATEERWSAWQVDGAQHRALWIAGLSSIDLPGTWLRDLLLHPTDGMARTIAVILEPISPRESRQAIEREAARLDSDEEQRLKAGFRVGAGHRQHLRAIAERERELVSGFPELRFAGVVSVAATDAKGLDDAALGAIQAAAGAGIDLRILYGRQAAAVASTLPLARSLAPVGRRS